MPQRVVVEPGDTLWSIAADHYPNDDPRDRAEEIESYNHLQGVSVHPGEVLQLPAD
jgi:LysM repeat protein